MTDIETKRVRVLVATRKRGQLAREPKTVEAFVCGRLCVHEEYVRADSDETTGRWVVSHAKTGRGACGDLRFKSRARAIYFMRLLCPNHDAWKGDNPYQIAARAYPLYQEALASLKKNDPVKIEREWRPALGKHVIVLRRDKKTGHESAVLRRVDAVGDVVMVDRVKYMRGESGGWISVPRQRIPYTAVIVPNVAANRLRFLVEKQDVESPKVKLAVLRERRSPTKVGKRTPARATRPPRQPTPRR